MLNDFKGREAQGCAAHTYFVLSLILICLLIFARFLSGCTTTRTVKVVRELKIDQPQIKNDTIYETEVWCNNN